MDEAWPPLGYFHFAYLSRFKNKKGALHWEPQLAYLQNKSGLHDQAGAGLLKFSCINEFLFVAELLQHGNGNIRLWLNWQNKPTHFPRNRSCRGVCLRRLHPRGHLRTPALALCRSWWLDLAAASRHQRRCTACRLPRLEALTLRSRGSPSAGTTNGGGMPLCKQLGFPLDTSTRSFRRAWSEPRFPVELEGDEVQLKDIPIWFQWRLEKSTREKRRQGKGPSPESSPTAVEISGRSFWDPHRAGFGPSPSRERRTRKPPLMRKMEGIIRNFRGEETRVGIQTGEGADAALRG
jgi:hypothetical protein